MFRWSGIGLVSLGVFFTILWLTGQQYITLRVLGLMPMGLNSSAAAIFCGLGLLVSGKNRPKIAAAMFFLFAIPTIQLILGLPVRGIHTMGDGSVPPNTHIILGLLTLILTFWRVRIFRSLLAVALLVLVTVAWLGYLFQIQTAYSWGNETALSFMGGFVYFVFGAVTLHHSRDNFTRRPHAAAAVVILFGLGVSMLLYQALLAEGYGLISRAIHVTFIFGLIASGLFGALIWTVLTLRTAHTALAQKTKQLEESNAELERFSYVASHDLQEPLRTIENYLGLIETKYGPIIQAEDKESIVFINQALARSRTLINDLFTYSKVGQTAEETDVAMDALIRHVLRDTGRVACLVGQFPTIRASQFKLHQLWLNLISNAFKYVDPARPPLVEIGAVKIDEVWRFWVRDNGIGIPPEHHTRIFEPFERHHHNYPGTGIGLAVCQRVVTEYGGQIWIEDNSPEPGVTFYFTIGGLTS